MMAAASSVPVPRSSRRATRSSFDVIVVGSGVGGAVSAALLAARGLRVLVLEKNGVLGGVLASRHRDGFKLDVGSHLISRGAKGPLGEVFAELGLSRPRFLTHAIPVRSRGMFDLQAPEQRRELPAYARLAAEQLELPSRDVLSLARMLFQVFTLTELELRRWDRRTLDEFIRHHTEHPGAYFLFSFLASIFFVLPPWQVSAGEAIRCLRWVISDYSLSYVEGGMDSIPHALLGRVGPAGGEIVTGHRVVAIRRKRGGLVVATDDGNEHGAPSVICDLGPKELLELLDDLDVPEEWERRVRTVRGSGNAHQIKLGLARPLVPEGCLIGGVSLSGLTLRDLSQDLMRDTVGHIDRGAVSDPLAIYAPVPSNYDPSVAPPGCQLIVASVYAPTRPDPADPPERWRARILEAFASVVPGLSEELLFVEFDPVPSIGAWMGKRDNPAISNGQYPGQVGGDRLPVATPIPGLYLAGDGAGGRGIGTELAAQSARAAVRELLLGLGRLPLPQPTFHWMEAA